MTSDNVDEVNKKLDDIDSRLEGIKLDKITEHFVIKAKKIADLEERSRRNNLRFDEFQEKINETWEESERIITTFVKEKLGIEEDILIETGNSRGRYREMMAKEIERQQSL